MSRTIRDCDECWGWDIETCGKENCPIKENIALTIFKHSVLNKIVEESKNV